MYSLEKMVDKFTHHAKIADKYNKELIEKFIKDYPDVPLPQHFSEDFSLPLALACICSEVLEIKKQINKG